MAPRKQMKVLPSIQSIPTVSQVLTTASVASTASAASTQLPARALDQVVNQTPTVNAPVRSSHYESKRYPNAIIYVRVSSPSQAVGFSVSLDSQEDECRRFCSHMGMTVVRAYRDVGSGRKQNKNLELALQDLDATTCLVVFKICRFARNLPLGLDMVKQLRSKGSTIYSATEQFHLVAKSGNTTAFGQHMLNTLLATAAFESEQIGERVKQSYTYRKAIGSETRAAPFGMEVQNSTIINDEGYEINFRKFVPCQHERNVLKLIYMLATSGSRLVDINSMLRSLTTNPTFDPLVLENNGHQDTHTDGTLGYACIAGVLNMYGIMRRTNQWSPMAISKIINARLDEQQTHQTPAPPAPPVPVLAAVHSIQPSHPVPAQPLQPLQSQQSRQLRSPAPAPVSRQDTRRRQSHRQKRPQQETPDTLSEYSSTDMDEE